MKLDSMIIRIAVGAVALLLVAAALLRSDQVTSSGTIEIAAPPYEVWRNLTDADVRPMWMEFVTEAIEVMGAYGTASSSLMLKVQQDDMAARHIYEDVVMAAPPLRLVTKIDDPQNILNIVTTYELTPRGENRTALRITVDRSLQGNIAPFFAVVIQGTADDNVDHNLTALKQVIEAANAPLI